MQDSTSHSFSIITPTFNASRWIRSCVESVADQEGVRVQHIVQDGLSTDGTAEYLFSEPRLEGESKKDQGMYDAINQAWLRARGDYVLHLNADEQLLPGALKAVGDLFARDPKIDVVVASTLVCNPDGSLRFYRKALRPPLSILLTSHHPVQSCAVFFRRSSLENRSWLYDPRFRLVSDALLMIDIVREKMKIGLLPRFTSVFLMTGENISLSKFPINREEYAYQLSLAKPWMRRMKPLFKVAFQLRKLLSGQYFQKIVEYDLYVPGKHAARQHFVVRKPSGIYRED